MQLKRQKERNLKLSLAYRVVKWAPLPKKRKFKILLDLAWIFARLSHEYIFKAAIHLPRADNEIDTTTAFISPGSSVLDIGCGQGYVIERMLSKTKNIVGIDYNAHSIAVAQKKLNGSGVKLICDDVFNYLKGNPTQFDYVILSHVLEHIDDASAFLKSLRPFASHFYIEVPDFDATYLNQYRQFVGTDLIYSDADHVYEFTRNELQAIISGAGLTIVQVEFRFGVMKFWCSK